MRRCLLISLLMLVAGIAQAQPVLHVAVLENRNYIVGANNAPSGLHRYEGDTTWTHLGWTNLRNFGVDATPDGTIYLAAGNGAFRSRDGGASWRITTGWEVTEVLDVDVAPSNPATIYIATAYGVWRTTDGGETWAQQNSGLSNPPFTQAIAVDRANPERVLTGGEGGLYESTDGGEHWQQISAVPIREIQQHPADPDVWLVGTGGRGVMVSHDGGTNWQFSEGVTSTMYAVAADPLNPEHMVAAGFETGVFVSTDSGQTWALADGMAGQSVHALLFDESQQGRLWAGTLGAGVYYSDDLGQTWQYA
ncbi:MAG TPA: hypothetical protein VKP65_25660, partial [Rhodothermales bacterium]|nr:hypothetical protein [Rhodothermales bacterium]